MNWKTWVPLVLAIVLGLVAAKAAHDVMLKNKGTAGNNGKFTKIVVAKADIQPGESLSADDLTMAQIDTAHAPATAFDGVDRLVGRVSELLVVKGQPIVESMLAPVGSGSGLQALVPTGMRAITIEVNEFSGVAGLITPGCRVDVIATMNDTQGDARMAKTIVQNVKVTAVGQHTAMNESAATPALAPNEIIKSVTVLASLEDAEAIELACSTGRPRLVLRGGRDQEVNATVGVSMADLKGGNGRLDPVTTVAIAPPTTTPTQVIAVTPPPKTVRSTVAAVPRRMVRVIRAGRVSVVSLAAQEQVPSNGTDFGPSEEMPEDAVGTIDIFGK